MLGVGFGVAAAIATGDPQASKSLRLLE
jgi:hypothetical protein